MVFLFSPAVQRRILTVDRAQNGGMKLTYAEYRSKVLNHLKEKGFVGISDFMYATMMSLRQPGTKVPTVPAATTARRRNAV